MTPRDLINIALKQAGVLGVGETASAEDMNDALTLLNAMLGQWSRKRWLVYHLVETSKVCTGSPVYTVGVGGDFNIMPPDRIEDAFIRMTNTSGQQQVDYPLTILQAREDYDRITMKNLQSVPQYVFYDAAYPLGNLYIWPVGTFLYELHILTKAVLGPFTNLSQTVNLSPEYTEAMFYNLACRLRPFYQMAADESLVALAKAALATIRAENTNIPQLTVPRALSNKNTYDPYTDVYR